jgi:hypothetical protein
MSLLRIPFILSAALVAQFATTPPNPPPEESEKATPTGLEVVFVKMIPWIPVTSKVHCSFHFLFSLSSANTFAPSDARLGLDIY